MLRCANAEEVKPVDIQILKYREMQHSQCGVFRVQMIFFFFFAIATLISLQEFNTLNMFMFKQWSTAISISDATLLVCNVFSVFL